MFPGGSAPRVIRGTAAAAPSASPAAMNFRRGTPGPRCPGSIAEPAGHDSCKASPFLFIARGVRLHHRGVEHQSTKFLEHHIRDDKNSAVPGRRSSGGQATNEQRFPGPSVSRGEVPAARRAGAFSPPRCRPKGRKAPPRPCHSGSAADGPRTRRSTRSRPPSWRSSARRTGRSPGR